jgi:hypothetical protein
VSAPGTVSGGTLLLRGGATLIGGTLPSLRITGATKLNESTKATGAVSVADGTLTISDKPLNISIP